MAVAAPLSLQAAAEVAERALFRTQEDLIAARFKYQH